MKAVAVLSIAVLLFLAPSAASQVPDDKLIVPGQRIGKWTLEMTIPSLVQMLGQPTQVAPLAVADVIPPQTQRYWWGPAGLYAITRDGSRVEFLLVDETFFRTEKNIGPGSSRAAVLEAYGPPTLETRVTDVRTRMIYDSIGFAAVIERSSVPGVNVFRPGSASTIWR